MNNIFDKEKFHKISKKIINYLNITGRMPRDEFWIFNILKFLYLIGSVQLINFLAPENHLINNNVITIVLFFFIMVLILSIWVSMIVLTFIFDVKRLHDLNMTGLCLLAHCIPVAGMIWLFFMYLRPGQTTANDYGPNPNAEDAIEQ